jgi:hypothetical protein
MKALSKRTPAQLQALVDAGNYSPGSDEQIAYDLVVAHFSSAAGGGPDTNDTYVEEIDISAAAGALFTTIAFGATLDSAIVSTTLSWPLGSPIPRMTVRAGTNSALGVTLDFSAAIVAGSSVLIVGKKQV